nr:PfkB family carbohydrate kinase [Pseudarthrobacter psychrotolerans]
MGANQVIIKQGAEGALSFKDGHFRSVSTFPVIAVDEVGAGDAFAAGFLACTLLGGEPDESLRWAAALGAWAVATEGDWEGLPTQPELAAFLTADKNTESVSR